MPHLLLHSSRGRRRPRDQRRLLPAPHGGGGRRRLKEGKETGLGSGLGLEVEFRYAWLCHAQADLGFSKAPQLGQMKNVQLAFPTQGLRPWRTVEHNERRHSSRKEPMLADDQQRQLTVCNVRDKCEGQEGDENLHWRCEHLQGWRLGTYQGLMTFHIRGSCAFFHAPALCGLRLSRNTGGLRSSSPPRSLIPSLSRLVSRNGL